MDQRLILVTLLIRLGVAAAISSVLVRARRFRVLLFREERTVRDLIPRLKAARAQGIVEYPLNKIVM